jgi:hypothetical protein
MKTIFDSVIKILLVVLFAILIYEFHIFNGEYRNHDRYFLNTYEWTSLSSYLQVVIFDKRTGDIYKLVSGQMNKDY